MIIGRIPFGSRNARIPITHKDLTDRARKHAPNAHHISLTNFLDSEMYNQLVTKLLAAQNQSAANDDQMVKVSVMAANDDCFEALIALLNGLLGGIGGWFDHPTLTLQEILGYVFAPVAWLLGVPWNEAVIAGSFIGQKVVVNEFVAYLDFINYRDTLSAHTQAIVTFALCGFANLSSIAILLGGLGGMAPSRRKDIARLGLRAVLAGSMAIFLSSSAHSCSATEPGTIPAPANSCTWSPSLKAETRRRASTDVKSLMPCFQEKPLSFRL